MFKLSVQHKYFSLYSFSSKCKNDYFLLKFNQLEYFDLSICTLLASNDLTPIVIDLYYLMFPVCFARMGSTCSNHDWQLGTWMEFWYRYKWNGWCPTYEFWVFRNNLGRYENHCIPFLIGINETSLLCSTWLTYLGPVSWTIIIVNDWLSTL